MKAWLIFFSFLIVSHCSFAQSYKWVTGGGSTDILGPSTTRWERVTSMCTDKNKNLYLSAIVGNHNIKADTFYEAVTSNTTPAFLLASYKCNGTMRWAKLFEAYWDAESYDLLYDGGSYVYLAGELWNKNKRIGYDTTINLVNPDVFVAKFDTSGKLKWIKFVGADNANTLAYTGGYQNGALAIDKFDNIHLYTRVGNNVQLSPTVLSTTGTYDIKYDSSGSLISATRMPIDSVYTIAKVFINQHTNNAYALIGNGFIAAYDPSDNQLWADTSQTVVILAATYDGGRYIYAGSYGDPAIFAHDTLDIGHRMEIFRVDTTDGHPEEITQLQGGSSGIDGITLLPHGKIACVGTIEGYVQYGTDSIPGAGQHSFTLIVDTNKNLYLLDQLPSNGYYDWASAITSDNEGNVYLGGQVEDTIGAGDLPGYHSNGGNTDFYVVKYGYNCDCDLSTEPTPMFTVSGDSMHVPDAVTFTYTGANTPDSVRWNFGDGTTSTTLNPAHSYTDTGIIKVCLTVYGCDSGTYCTYIKTLPPVGVSNLAAFPNIQVYPNPVSNTLFLSGVPTGTQVKLYNVIGQQVYEGTTKDNRHIIHTEDLTVGTYILQLTNKDGERMNMTVIKQ